MRALALLLRIALVATTTMTSMIVSSLALGGCIQSTEYVVTLPDFGVAPSSACTNGKLDQNETDLDCGGVCGATCTFGQRCAGTMDCASGTCMSGVCAPMGSGCLDHTRDGNETDVDCGGSCPKCADGKRCAAASDCASGVCGAGVCAVGKPRFDFFPARFAGVGRGPGSIAAADFDGDGRLDVAVSAHQSRDVSVLLGLGDGTFHAAMVTPLSGDPQALIATDLDKDGRPDLVSAVSDGTLALLGNRGGGVFEIRGMLATDMGPADVIATDINRDGNLDLIVSARQAGTVTVLAGAGDGRTFKPIDQMDPMNPMKPGIRLLGAGVLAAGDLDGDGLLDLAAIANYQVNLLVGDGKGGLAKPAMLAIAPYPWFVAASDLRKSGKLDLVTSSYEGHVMVSLATGHGMFEPPLQLDVGGVPGTVRVADFDGDGALDLASINLLSNVLHVFRGNGTGGFEGAQNFYLGGTVQTIAVGDWNGDGSPDIALCDYWTHDVGVMLNRAGQ